MKLAALALATLLCAGCATSAPAPAGWHLVPGGFEPGRGPDGNSVFLDAPEGLILVDTGRHPAHQEKLLAYAHERGRPIAAIVNTHWHLDHTTGNLDIRTAYPKAQVYATLAVDGALATFLADSRKRAEAKPTNDPNTLRFLARMKNPDSIRPTVPVTKSRPIKIAGRKLDVHVAPFAATEADLWLFVPDEGLVIAGDLVVGIVPFMDTACADGWKKALGEIAATPFTTLIPGHGQPMNRAQFMQWKGAFDRFVDCGRSTKLKEECVAGWKRDAAPFIDPEHSDYVTEAAGYYLDTRLRSSPAEQQKYCKPLR